MEKIAFASESNNFTLGREVLTASGGHPGTASAEDSSINNNKRRISQGGATSSHATNHNLINNGNSEANDTLRGSNLPSMLQNMKSQLSSNHQAAMLMQKAEKASAQKIVVANYGVVGRSVSPGGHYNNQFGGSRR